MSCGKYKSSSQSEPRLLGWFSLLVCLGSAATVFAATPVNEATVKIETRDSAFAARLKAQGATLIGDYGTYQLFEAPPAPALSQLNGQTRARQEYNMIRLNAGPLDTSKAETRATRKAVESFTGKRMHLVHFAGPPQPAWIQELRDAGVRLVGYVPQNAYLVFGDAASLKKVRSLAARALHIQWEGAYLPEHRLTLETKTQGASRRLNKTATDAFAIQMVDDPESNPATLAILDGFKLDAPIRFERTRGFVNVVVRLPSEALTELGNQSDVISIRPYYPRTKSGERQGQIVAGNLDGSLPTGPGYLDWLASKGFTQEQFQASGLIVDIADSGLDNGTTLPNHMGLYEGGVTSAPSRVVYARLEGTPNGSSTLQGCDGHGTLNTHIVAGYDSRTGFPFEDALGFNYGLGICPFVRVGSSVVFDPSSFTYPNYPDMISRAYHSGARISSNSWGEYGNGSYDIDAQAYDALVRDAQPAQAAQPADGNQEMVIVFAAGNDGASGSSTINPPGSAKNVICVGASENVQSIGGTDRSGISDSGANSADDIANFSSRGPCADGRQKPDLVAPGTHVSGGVFQVADPGPNGQADACFTGDGVSGGASGSFFFPPGQQYFTASSGTSHSTPAVAGGAALLRQYFINQGMPVPSPAMTKAFLVNSARYLTGTGANDSLWSPRQGMGGMDLGRTFDGVPRMLRDQLPEDLFTSSGETRTYTAVIKDSSAPLRVTLAWTDAPGSTTGSAFNNDIDLMVHANGVTYLGNVFSGAYSAEGGTADFKNNMESVILPAGITGPVTIQVAATSINSDGVPNNSFAMDQDFALVAYNAELVAMPSLREAGAELLGEDCAPANGVADPGETVTFAFSLENKGTLGTTNLTATLLSTGGVVAVSGPQAYGSLEPGAGASARSFKLIGTGDCGDTVAAHLLLQEGDKPLGIARFKLGLGLTQTVTNFVENFDAAVPPALPSGWISSQTMSGTAPVLASGMSETTPNAAFLAEPDQPGTSDLLSPEILISGREAQLAFLHYHDTEIDPYAPTLGYDGGLLEIRIGTNEFKEILAAGGKFVTGGYTRELDTAGDNPMQGRKAWCGNSGWFTETLVSLPASAAGEFVQLKWRLATDSGNYYGGTGWYIDSVRVMDGLATCCTNVTAGPVKAQVMLAGNSVLVRVDSTLGFNYVLEYSDDLASDEWLEIQPAVAGTGYQIVIQDPAGSGSRRFYRVRAFKP
jgi:hypothetical protein